MRALATALVLSPSERTDLLSMAAEGASTPAPDAFPPLPDPLTPLIGREAAIADILVLLQEQRARHVTLTGPGGVGKTSLALEVARHLEGTVPDGVIVVPLDALDDPADLTAWIAARLGLTGLARGSETQVLQGYLAECRLVLVLDNFEHLLAAARDVATLLAASPGLQVLVTSRAPLRLRGEREVPVEPLAVPDLTHIPTPDELVTSTAVQLFLERARAWSPSFALTQANASAIAAICRRLDGLPLALELAAARLRILSPTELLGRLDQALPLLTGGARDLPERQRTIRQAIDWSYRILAEDEQALFRRLGIFVGGWDAAAAEAIGMGPVTLDLLVALAEHSLVVVDATDAATRFRMLETIREYAREQLDAHGEAGTLARRHAGWCLGLAEEAATHYYQQDEDLWLDRLEQEHPNLRAAVVYATREADDTLLLRLIAALGRFWSRREHFGQDRAWMERALRIIRMSVPSPEGATVLFNVGRLAWDQGERDRGMALLRESLTAWTALGDERGACSAAVILANTLRLTGETAEAEELLHHSRDSLARLGDEPFWLSTALRLLGIMALERKDWPEAESLLEAALAAALESRYPWAIASALHNLAHLHHLRGDHVRSLARFTESLRISLQTRDYWPVAVTFPPVAEVLVALGEMEPAARLFGAASSLGEMMSARLSAPLPVVESHKRASATARDTLGAEAFDALWQSGRSLTPEEAFADLTRTAERILHAPAAATPPASTTTWPAGLTLREVEVIRLVAAGLTNAQVADRLFLSRRTVDAHLRRIYDKLDLATRTELARFAHEQALT
jgi:predicted ATPase/DNA-binding CsgD family transcriptional regulator